ncbi:hypothetical protein SPRG_03027 [Saprolegnia parasitica CBS 223.65]|uniref:Uncharacterized protein n=1 Tax=Saprolegnia parasitica (strain CBS 223.65) TaxID=695850 RepID=A0A067D0H9_SAPPC|nr:hypothetical protein SPRG_03027 [Saprolegnia parasitica CBS 223.65]KDO32552.1 hypothetical protein SPRG_03027 [Saprolegnia parasitica CBS 223.65]|eukprot:XP_012196998.1 hypothetical protein SPRG_03027 [Saprolegnia parasitica CBS 223.65]
MTTTTSLTLRAMGFCGADDSVHPKLLQTLSVHYPWIEWGVLFRPDLEGSPRYATSGWVQQLAACARATPMKLAGHLCGSRCQDILAGDASFVQELYAMGFHRVQVNATAANHVLVEAGRIDEYVANIRRCMARVPQVEWIIQCNTETKAIWEPLAAAPPANMSLLFDASCGLGVPMTEFPKPLPNIPCGYAGGIGPNNIRSMLERVQAASGGAPVWVDMESSLRLKVLECVTDVFSVEKCFVCADVGVTAFGLALEHM